MTAALDRFAPCPGSYWSGQVMTNGDTLCGKCGRPFAPSQLAGAARVVPLHSPDQTAVIKMQGGRP